MRARVVNGMVAVKLGNVDNLLSLAQAKSLRDDISETIYECEGGDPVEWKSVVFERSTTRGVSRVWQRGDHWAYRVWIDGDVAAESDRPTQQEAMAAAEAVLG